MHDEEQLLTRCKVVVIFLGLWFLLSNLYLMYSFKHWELELVLLSFIQSIFIDKNYSLILTEQTALITFSLILGSMLAWRCTSIDSKKDLHGKSKFATFQEVKKDMLLNNYKQRGLILGIYTDKIEQYFIKKSNRLIRSINKLMPKKLIVFNQTVSAIMIAPPGTGKTAGVIIPNMLYTKHSVIVLDVKGEIHDTTSNYRKSLGKVMVFNPAGANSTKYNPLDKKVLPKELVKKLQVGNKLVNTLIKQEQGKQDYFKKAAIDLFNLLIGFVIINDHYAEQQQVQVAFNAEEPTSKLLKVKPNISYAVNNLLSDLGNHAQLITGEEQPISRQQQFGVMSVLLEMLMQIATIAEDEKVILNTQIENMKNKADEYQSMADDQYSGVIGTIMADCNVFRDDLLVQQNTSENDIDFEAFYQGTQTLYITINAEDIDRLKNLLALFFEDFAMYALSRKKQKNDNPITLLIDEFPRLPKMPQIADMPALSRGQGVNVLFVAQSIGQLRETYGREGAQKFFDTCAYQIILPQSDTDSAKQMSNKLGKKTIQTVQSSTSTRDAEVGISHSEQAKELMAAEEVMAMKLGACIITGQFFGTRPIKANIPMWFLFDGFKNRAK